MFNSNFVLSLKNSSGQILREYGDKVYLPFYEEYKLLLKNLRFYRALVSLKIDGTDVLGGHRLVIAPNDSIDLERFIEGGNFNSGPRFKFVPITGNAQDPSSSENGVVVATIQWEAFPNITWTYTTAGTGNYIPPKVPIYTDYHVNYCASNASRGNVIKSMSIGNTMTNISKSFCSEQSCTPTSNSQKGVTIGGSQSNQKFGSTFVPYLSPEIVTLRLRILAPDQETRTIEDTKKRYCINCGKKIKSSYIFCPKCGTKQE